MNPKYISYTEPDGLEASRLSINPDCADIKDKLKEQLVSPSYWEKIINNIKK